MVQSFGIIAKLRAELVEFVYTAFVEWKPAHLIGDSLTVVRSIYKTMRIALVHLNRYTLSLMYTVHSLTIFKYSTPRSTPG